MKSFIEMPMVSLPSVQLDKPIFICYRTVQLYRALALANSSFVNDKTDGIRLKLTMKRMITALSLLALALTTTPAQLVPVAPTMTITYTDSYYWLPGNVKHFHLEWTNLTAGDPYKVTITSVFALFGEAYGFTIKEGTLPTTTGTLDFDTEFPTTAESANPDYPSVPQDGRHVALFYDQAKDFRAWSSQFRLVLSEVQLSSFSEKPITARLNEDFWPLVVNVDATYSPSDIASVTLPILVYTTSADDVLQVALFDGDRQVSNVQIIRADPYGKNWITFETHGFSVSKGSQKYLFVKMIAKKGAGIIECAINIESPDNVAFGPRNQPLSTSVDWWGGPAVTLVGSKR